ncbi:MAG: Mbeg1-like protein [Aristaeellaceae bacterium]
MSTNASISARPLPDGVSDTAVMEMLAENPYIAQYAASKASGEAMTLSDFAAYCQTQEGAGANGSVQILSSYLEANADAGSWEILNVTQADNQGRKVLIRGGDTYYVGFQGTQEDEWVDNGEGMAQCSTLQQQDAADYFDRMVEQYGITDADNVVVTGHSKGGNKAQYVTMASEHADLVDTCVALDGQGFSPEAIALWSQYPEVYEARRDKIILVAGSNDFVHVLGERIARDENVYYLAYDEGCTSLTDYAGTVGRLGIATIATFHMCEYLFQHTWDPEQGCYVFSAELQPPGTQSEFSQQIQEISNYLMSLPAGEREAAAATLMALISQMSGGSTLDGRSPTLTDIISTLNTLYDLLDKKLGTWDDAMLSRYAPQIYASLETIHTVIDGLQALNNAWQAYRVEKARAAAKSLAASNPYIYIDTTVWSQLGSTLRVLANADYGRIRLQLIDIRDELQTILYASVDILARANSLMNSLSATAIRAGEAIAAFASGNIIAGVYSTVEAAQSAYNAAKSAISLVSCAIRDITLIYNSVSSAVEKVAAAIALLGVEDSLRDMGTYLTDTAQEFQMAESQNLACMQQWGVC